MRDEDCVDFLQWFLPKLGLRWEGYRKVRGQVCKRIGRRMAELEIDRLGSYKGYLQANPEEWDRLAFMCRITISRFYRDHRVFDRLIETVLPELARSRRPNITCWSAGCASGEEPYTLKICWMERAPASKPIEIVATDIDPHMLDRARRGCYQRATLKEFPDELIDRAFEASSSDELCVREEYRNCIRWMQHDIRERTPQGPFDLVLCRNLAFMYFDEEGRRRTLERLLSVLHPGGALIAGKHDRVPESPRLEPWFEPEKIYRKTK